MDTEYVRATLEPLLLESVAAFSRGDLDRARQLRVHVAEELIALGFSAAVASRGVCSTWNVKLATHLWEADHVLPVVHGGGGSCGLDNLRTLCRACHTGATASLARVRAKDRHVRAKEKRHAERMALRRAGAQLPLTRWTRGRR